MKKPELLDILNTGYETEATGLAFIANSESFPAMLPVFQDYMHYIADRARSVNFQDLMRSVSTAPGIIPVTADSQVLREIFYLAYLACCCELFDGWDIPLSILMGNSLNQFIHETIATEISSKPDRLYYYSGKLHSADAVRTIQILRLLGAITFNSRQCRQLSLGAGYGRKDIEAIHKVPEISRVCGHNNSPDDTTLDFSTSDTSPEHVILIDNDKNLKRIYDKLNSENEGLVYALNQDAFSALDLLPGLIEEGSIGYRNFIIGIRVDHRMIEDVPGFFNRIVAVMEPQADFVITVGSGYSVDEYEGRLKLISDIFSYLRNKDLEPVRLILHTGRTLKENRERPSFGCAATASHEILHCKLVKAKLL